MTNNTTPFKLYTDGGARGNPGPSGIGFILFNETNLEFFDAKFLENATNNQAEYLALILGLEYCKKNKITSLDCYLDSELVVKQLNGEYKVKNSNMVPLFDKITGLRDVFDTVTFNHVPRAENKFADKLVNIALDAKLK